MNGAGRRGSLASRNRRVACEAPSKSRAARPKRVRARPAEALALVDTPPGASGEGWPGGELTTVERTAARAALAPARRELAIAAADDPLLGGSIVELPLRSIVPLTVVACVAPCPARAPRLAALGADEGIGAPAADPAAPDAGSAPPGVGRATFALGDVPVAVSDATSLVAVIAGDRTVESTTRLAVAVGRALTAESTTSGTAAVGKDATVASALPTVRAGAAAAESTASVAAAAGRDLTAEPTTCVTLPPATLREGRLPDEGANAEGAAFTTETTDEATPDGVDGVAALAGGPEPFAGATTAVEAEPVEAEPTVDEAAVGAVTAATVAGTAATVEVACPAARLGAPTSGAAAASEPASPQQSASDPSSAANASFANVCGVLSGITAFCPGFPDCVRTTRAIGHCRVSVSCSAEAVCHGQRRQGRTVVGFERCTARHADARGQRSA